VRRDEPQFYDVDALPVERADEPAAARGLDVQVVSSGAGGVTLLATLPAGWRHEEAAAEATVEAFVLDGDLCGETAGGFVSVPRGAPLRLRSERGGRALLFWSPELALAGQEPRTTSVYREQWRTSGLPGMAHVSLRLPDPDGPPPGGAGGFIRLFSVVPGFRLDRQERHTCWEENLMLRGDIWMHERGTLRAGWCVANPPGLWHGPMVSKGGGVLLVHCDSPHTLEYRDDPGDPARLDDYLATAPWA
jgi:hypothetical protein